MSDKIDIGNVRGIQGEKGEKGDIGKTPTYDDIKYVKNNGEYVTYKGNGLNQCYVDADGNICNSEGYIIVNGEPSDTLGRPIETENGYIYQQAYIDNDGNFVDENGYILDENGEVKKDTTTFISDVVQYMYSDERAYNQIVNTIYPKISEELTSPENKEKYKSFLDSLEGDIKYYICEDNPKTKIILDENNEVVNRCSYRDEDGNVQSSVPLEKNALYLYNGSGYVSNDIMHYDIYLCLKANTIPIKLVSSADFIVNYNVIDDVSLIVPNTDEPEDEKDIKLQILSRGTRGQFYSINEVDTLFDNNVISKLGEDNGIAQLDSNGKVPSNQLPSYVDDIIEGTMNNNVFTPSNQSDNVQDTGKIYVDTITNKTYRWSGSTYVNITNPIIVDDNSSIAYGSAKGTALENKIGNSTLNTNDNTVTGAINELNNNKVDKVTGKGLSTNDFISADYYDKDYIDEHFNLNFIQKSQTVGLIKNDGTVDTNNYATSSNLSSLESRVSALENELLDLSDDLGA